MSQKYGHSLRTQVIKSPIATMDIPAAENISPGVITQISFYAGTTNPK